MLSISPRAISGWESDEYPPDDELKIRRLADLLGFPTSFFAMDDSNKTPAGAVSFRALTSKTAGQRDAVLAMCDLATDLTAWVDERFGLPLPNIPDLRGESPDIAASLLRQEWGLGVKPIKNMVHLLEAKGVRIFSLADNCREVDACSFWSGPTPFALVNTEVSCERLRFDLAHELAHLTLHKHAGPSGRTAENEANAFASEFLMPIESIHEHLPNRTSLSDLIRKKKIWNVSVSALAYRLHKLGYISDWHFKSLNIEMRRRGYKAAEPEGSPMEQSKVFELILGRLREIGMPLNFVANQTNLPEDEIRSLFFGLAKVSFDGDAEGDGVSKRPALRVVK